MSTKMSLAHRGGQVLGCLPPDLIGTATLTETTAGQAVDTGKGVVNVHGVNTFDYHGDFPNGITVQSGLTVTSSPFTSTRPAPSNTS